MRKFFHKLLGIKPKLTCAEHITVEEQLPRAEWDRMASQLHAAGIKQDQCSECHIWFWPFEQRRKEAS